MERDLKACANRKDTGQHPQYDQSLPFIAYSFVNSEES